MDWLKLVRTWSLPGVLLGGIVATALLPTRSPEAHGDAQAPPSASTAPASEVVQQARGLFAAAKYPGVLRLASTELAKTKPMGDGKSNERYELLLLKGESFLRMNQRSYAADAFEQAVRAAPDIREGAIARATSLLVRKSKQNRYEPATKAAARDFAPMRHSLDRLGSRRSRMPPSQYLLRLRQLRPVGSCPSICLQFPPCRVEV